MLCHLFPEIRILSFCSDLIMKQTSMSPCAKHFDASFPLNEFLVKRRNGCLNCPVQLIETVFFKKGFLFRTNFFIIFSIWIKQWYILLIFTPGGWVFSSSWKQSCFEGNYNLSFFLGYWLVWWAWTFLLFLPFVVEDPF